MARYTVCFENSYLNEALCVKARTWESFAAAKGWATNIVLATNIDGWVEDTLTKEATVLRKVWATKEISEEKGRVIEMFGVVDGRTREVIERCDDEQSARQIERDYARNGETVYVVKVYDVIGA